MKKDCPTLIQTMSGNQAIISVSHQKQQPQSQLQMHQSQQIAQPIQVQQQIIQTMTQQQVNFKLFKKNLSEHFLTANHFPTASITNNTGSTPTTPTCSFSIYTTACAKQSGR